MKAATFYVFENETVSAVKLKYPNAYRVINHGKLVIMFSSLDAWLSWCAIMDNTHAE